MKQGHYVYAAIAPAFVGQLGPKVTPEKLCGAMIQLGFENIVEVAVGADLCTVEEVADFFEKSACQTTIYWYIVLSILLSQAKKSFRNLNHIFPWL